MADGLTYKYKVKNLTDPSVVLGEIRKTKGVMSVEFSDGVLTYVVDRRVDEYDVLVAAINACDAVGAELIVGEEEKTSDYDYDAVYDDRNFADNGVIDGDIDEKEKVDDTETETVTGFEKDEEEAASVFDDYEEDRIVSAKKKLKTESLVRFIELSISFVVLLISFLVKPDPQAVISLRSILLIVSFALSVYEIFYAALLDVLKKKWFSECLYVSLACVLGAFINALTEIAILALVFAVAKEIQTYVEGLNELRIDERFYTGSFSIRTEDGTMKKVGGIAVGDVIFLDRYDVVPCDGVLIGDASFDCHNAGGAPEQRIKSGETVLAGSMLLDESASLTVTATNSDSVITKKKVAFKEKLASFTAAPSFADHLSLALFAFSLVIAFVLPAFYKEGYSKGLAYYGKIAIVVAFLSEFSYVFSSTYLARKSVLILYETLGIGCLRAEDFVRLGSANSFVFDAAALTENGEIKKDAFGALRETLDEGAKNVTTDFDGCDLNEDVKKKIDFVDKAFKGERKIRVGDDKDVSLSGNGKIDIGNGEISFVPLAYKLARKAVKRERASIIMFALTFALAVAGTIFMPLKLSVLYAALPFVITFAISSLFALLSASSKT